MTAKTAKESMLKRLRTAIDGGEVVAIPSPVAEIYRYADEDMTVAFTKQYLARKGSMHYCATDDEIASALAIIMQQCGCSQPACNDANLSRFLAHKGIETIIPSNEDGRRSPVSIMLCGGLLAWNGSLLLTDSQGVGNGLRRMASHLVVVAFTSQVVPDWNKAMERHEEQYGCRPSQMLSFCPDDADFLDGTSKLYLLLIEDQ